MDPANPPPSQEPYEFKELGLLNTSINSAALPQELKNRALAMLERLNRMARFGGYSTEYEVVSRYIGWITDLPWAIESQDTLDLVKAQEILNKNHYGMQKVKDRILEYLSVLQLKSQAVTPWRASVICLIGLPGIGKTTVAKSVAEALGRQFIRIAMGGMGSASQLRGQTKNLPNAEPGEIIKGLRKAKSRNPVILFDEIDRVSENVRADVMGVLLEVLDPEQNYAFTDYYIDFPFDLSKALFICSGNNTGGVSYAVLDRVEVIEMPSYTDEEKQVIGKNYLFPKALADTNLTPAQLMINDTVWANIIRPLGYDAGIRTLDRTIRGICSKVARLIVEGKGTQFVITPENVKDFLPTW